MATFWQAIKAQCDAFTHSGLPVIFWNWPSNGTWTVDKIGDYSGKVVIVTGGNSGTGYETARAMYNAGAKVYMLCRNESKTKEAIEMIKRDEPFDIRSQQRKTRSNSGSDLGSVRSESESGTGGQKGRLEYIEMDLTDLESVDRSANEFMARENQLDILFANAGIMATPEGQWTKQGYSLQFGTNAIGHHRLISLLLPLLLSTAKVRAEPTRVIITTSFGHVFAPTGGVDYRSVVRSTADPTNLAPKRGTHERDRVAEYGQSKWANIAFAKYLEKHYGERSQAEEERLISAAVHPGTVATNLPAHIPGVSFILQWLPWLVPLLGVTPAQGALNQLYAATVPAEEVRRLNISGGYVVPWQHVGTPRYDLVDEDASERVEELWRWCEEQGKKRV